jgi:hypothetical protein
MFKRIGRFAGIRQPAKNCTRRCHVQAAFWCRPPCVGVSLKLVETNGMGAQPIALSALHSGCAPMRVGLGGESELLTRANH